MRRAMIGWPRCTEIVDGEACGHWLDPSSGSGAFGSQMEIMFRCENQPSHLVLTAPVDREVMGLE